MVLTLHTMRFTVFQLVLGWTLSVNGQTIDDFECAIQIKSTDHSSGVNGKYFNFIVPEVDYKLGSQWTDGDTFNVFYSGDSSWHQVVLWRASNGGSGADGHGRRTQSPSADQWAAGEFFAFEFSECGGDSIDFFQCPVDIKSNDHSSGIVGKYFNFDVAEVNCILGSPFIANTEFNVFYSGDNSWHRVVLWSNSNGGSVGDGHGRRVLAPDANQWEVGHYFAFDDMDLDCPCTIENFDCPLKIESNDHSTGPIGQYFNFFVPAVDCILGSPLIDNFYYHVFYSGDNSWHNVIVWRNPNGGTVGDGHGRRMTSPGAEQWAVGEYIAFDNRATDCHCASIDDFECPFNILSTDHSVGAAGTYFNFNVATVDCILGSSFVTNSRFYVFYSGTNEWRRVVLWREANGGSIVDGHGRKDVGQAAGDWADGEMVAFSDSQSVCGCTQANLLNAGAVPVMMDNVTNGSNGYFKFAVCSLGFIIAALLLVNVFVTVTKIRRYNASVYRPVSKSSDIEDLVDDE